MNINIKEYMKHLERKGYSSKRVFTLSRYTKLNTIVMLPEERAKACFDELYEFVNSSEDF